MFEITKKQNMCLNLITELYIYAPKVFPVRVSNVSIMPTFRKPMELWSWSRDS